MSGPEKDRIKYKEIIHEFSIECKSFSTEGRVDAVKYLWPCILFLASNEAISLFALLIIAGMFLYDIAKEALKWSN